MKIKYMRDIIPLFNEQGMTTTEVAEKVGRKRITIARWVKTLRKNGFEIKIRMGRSKLKI